MIKDVRIVASALLCLMLVSGGCNAYPTYSPTPWPTLIDRGLFYGEPCAPPCWEGITPGISSEEDVVRRFEQLKSEGRIIDYELTLWDYQADLSPSPSSSRAHLIFHGGRVDYLIIRYDLQEFDYRVRQVVERFGEPEAYARYSGVEREECYCKEWDDSRAYTQPSTVGYLLYPSQGLTFYVAVAEGYQGCICPEMRVGTFYYYQPRSLADALGKDPSPVIRMNKYSQEDIVQWHGYGPGY